MINEQIQIFSLKRKINKAKLSGKLNINTIKLFNSMLYALEKAEEFSQYSNQFEEIIICIKQELSKLQYKYPKDICNYKIVLSNTSSDDLDNIVNTAPTLDNNTLDILSNEEYIFTRNDFLVNFQDAENDSYMNLIIYPSTLLHGSLIYNNQIIDSPIIIDLRTNNISLLKYTRSNQDIFNENPFTFRVSDDNENFLYSSLKSFTISSTQSNLENLPPSDIGDNTIYASNRAVTTLTLFMFTGGLVAPYNDPEGDLIDAIRVIDISNANQGVYKLNNIEITEGQIITREEIEQGLFTHEAPDTDAISSDTFQFEARDESSQIWVS